MIKNIVFDLGNVLVDFDPPHVLSWKKLPIRINKRCLCPKFLVPWTGCVSIRER